MFTSPVDLVAYFQRIGHDGPRDASLETLQALHLRHTEYIPFENLTPFLGQVVQLEHPFLADKLVHQGRGGYCFEHNLFFGSVLQQLGFDVKGLAARVRWNVPEDVVTPRTHMVLLVEHDGMRHIADVGFGGMTLTAPLQLQAGVEQQTPHGLFRLDPQADSYRMQAKLGEEWKTLYVFDLQQQQLPDYQVTNWYLCTHVQSRFVSNLIAARTAPDRRHALLNNQYSVHHLNGETEKHVLTDVAAIKDTLAHAFCIRLPDHPELDGHIGRLLNLGS